MTFGCIVTVSVAETTQLVMKSDVVVVLFSTTEYLLGVKPARREKRNF